MLTVNSSVAGYGRLTVLHGVTLSVPKGGVVALLGGNGAGKTTTMKTIMGLLQIKSGSIEFSGTRIDREQPHAIFARGLSLIPQGRELFPEMTVAENLELGWLQRRDRSDVESRLDDIFAYLPRLRERHRQLAGTLSGGEQQMLATARALVSRPALLLMDEPSMGLAPMVVAEIARIIVRLKNVGQTILLVEQNVRLALAVADHVYVLRNGQIVAEGQAQSFRDDQSLFRSYIG